VPPICQKYEQIKEMLSSILGHFPEGGVGGKILTNSQEHSAKLMYLSEEKLWRARERFIS
jgi:hypothetical protein